MSWLRCVRDNVVCGLHKCRDKHERSRKRHYNNLQYHDTFGSTDAQDYSWLQRCTCVNCSGSGARNDTRIDIESIGVWACHSQQKLSLSLSQNSPRSGSVHPMALATNLEAPHSLKIRNNLANLSSNVCCKRLSFVSAQVVWSFVPSASINCSHYILQNEHNQCFLVACRLFWVGSSMGHVATSAGQHASVKATNCSLQQQPGAFQRASKACATA